jgi:putative addiction module component (TIGR02574 family)
MKRKSNKLLEEAMDLPAGEREALASKLFDSLEADDVDAEAAWQSEIAWRIEELDRGSVKPLSWETAKRLIFGAKDESS